MVLKDVKIGKRSKHKIYLADYTFTNINSTNEQELVDTNEKYKSYRRDVIQLMKSCLYNKMFPTDFAGMVKFIPTNKLNDIRKSAEIILCVFNRDEVNINAYTSAMKLLKDFIISNNIKSVQLSECDTLIRDINIVNDICTSAQGPIKIYIK